MSNPKSIPAVNHKEICLLLRKRLTATRDEQKSIRAKIRKLGFNISDYWTGFTDVDFRNLVKQQGEIKILTEKRPIVKPPKKKAKKQLSPHFKTALPPIVDPKTEVLILGSMPGDKSLEFQMYYHNPKNQFWKIVFSLINNSEIPFEYNKKIEILKKHKIGLWDVLEFCEREGSLDSNIKNEKANNFNSFFKKFPNIKVVCFNGQKSYSDFVSAVGLSHGKKYISLPSSSSAHAVSLSAKVTQWKTGLQK